MAKVVKSTRDITNVDEELKKLEKTDVKNNKKEVKKQTNNKGSNKNSDKNKKNDKNKKAPKKEKGVIGFLRGVKQEVSKVKWPSKKDMFKYSVATIVFVLFFAIFFYIIDLIMALLKAGV